MVKVVIPKYPEALTVKFWNKAKGVIARVSKVKTGITEELTKAEAAFNKMQWKDLETSTFMTKHRKGQGSLMPNQVDDLLRLYLETNHPPFKDLELTFYNLSQSLKKKASEFEKDDKLKSFAKAVSAMSDAANKFTYAISFGTMSSPNQAEFAKIRKEAEGVEKQWKEARGSINTLLNKAETAMRKAKSKTPTVSEYAAIWKQELRGIGAQIAMAKLKDEFAEPMKKVAKVWSEAGMPKKDEEVAKRVEDDLKYIADFKKTAAKVLV